MKLFLDSSAFVARALSDDAKHDAAMAVFTDLSQGKLPYRLLYSSNFVLDETVTFLLYQAGPRVAVETLNRLRISPSLRILHVSEDVESAADEVFRMYASSKVSYTDCTTKVLMGREGIDAGFSFDRDFEIMGLPRIP